MRGGALGPLSIVLGWLTALALVVGARTLVEYPLLEVSGGGSVAPESLAWIRVGYGTLAAGAGGLVTGALAPAAPLRHGAILAAAVALAALLYALPDGAVEPPGHDAAAVLLPAAAAFLGAWLRSVRRPFQREEPWTSG